jgi:hypothetical protein
MKWSVLSIALATLAGCSEPGAFTADAAFQDSLSDYTRALLAGDARLTIEMMDPRLVSSIEAKEEAISALQKATTTMVYHNVTFEKPFGKFTGSNTLHCFIPYVSDAQIGKQRATVKSYLLATHYEGSNRWFFVDVGTKSRSALAQYYENLPPELPKATLKKRE